MYISALYYVTKSCLFSSVFVQATPLPHGLDKIPDVQGYLVINSDGAVLAVSVNYAGNSDDFPGHFFTEGSSVTNA